MHAHLLVGFNLCTGAQIPGIGPGTSGGGSWRQRVAQTPQLLLLLE